MKNFHYLVFGMLVGLALLSGINSFAVDEYGQATVLTSDPGVDFDLCTDVDSDTAGTGGYLAIEGRAILVSTAGNFKIVTHKGNIKTIPLPTGWNPIRAKQIYITGTTGVGYIIY